MKSGSTCFALFLLCAMGAQAAWSAEDPNSPAINTVDKQVNSKRENTGNVEPVQPEPEPEPAMSMNEVIELLQQQQKELEKQKQLLHSQSQKIATLTAELDVMRAPEPNDPPESTEQIVAKTEQATQPITTSTQTTPETAEQAKTERQEDADTDESIAKAQADDPTRALLEDFKGAWRLPGTNAALAIGGYVKTSVVYNFDALAIKDRFIVGSIPVGLIDSIDIEAQSSITAAQSRLNFDLREPTKFGLLRAFIEGDFASQDDTFRLRHAFGQWKDVLAGKTWSAFVDTEASPEEVDFEGLNGRINVRQSQVRFMPKRGSNYEFQVSMEDPNPQVQNGSGVTRSPDFVFTGRVQPYERLHVKLAMIARQIRARRETRAVFGDEGMEKEYAWGTSISGRLMTPNLDDRDSLLFQFNAGNGIGRYVNDLSSVGDFDGIFNPKTGELELFDILAGYVSWQHWWGRNQMRSNFTFGMVDVDNPDFVADGAYKRTMRFSSNLLWTPTPRVDLGAEYLWGNRKNEDGENADATQIQLAVRYRF